MTAYLTHTACDIDKVPKRALKGHEGVEDMLQQYIVQLKYDGVCGIMCVDGDNIAFQTRTGERIQSIEHIADAFRAMPFDVVASACESEVPQLRDGVYIGEVWHPEMSFPDISGAARLHNADERSKQLQFVVCDFLTTDEFLSGVTDVGFLDRIERIAWMQGIYHPDDGGEFASQKQPSAPPVWFCGHEGAVADQAAVTINDLADEACAAGNYDGIILRKPDGPWVIGARDENIVKVKPLLSLDLRIIGTEPGKGKHEGRIGAIIVDYKGKPCRVGTGLSDEDRERTDLVGMIAEVRAMSESSKGLLREPRLKGLRFDTVPEDEK